MEPATATQRFPLQPFLLALNAEGFRVTVRDYERIALVLRTSGPWTIQRLRDSLRALLTHDQDQRERFDDCFATCFDPALETDPELAKLDLSQTLAYLEALAHPEQPVLPVSEPPLPLLPLPPTPLRRRRWWLPLAMLLSVVGLLALVIAVFARPLPAPPPPVAVVPTPISEPAAATGQQYRTYRNVPVIAALSSFERPRSSAWLLPFGLGLALLCSAGAYGLAIYVRRNPTDDGPARFDPDPRRPRYFSIGAIGGTPAPLLSDAALDELADALGYFASDEAGPELNVPASIEGTLRRGGVPALTFYRRRRLRSVLILEDSRAEARRWNSLPGELAAGLSLRGVPVIHGDFARTPERYTTADGAIHLLDDLEDQRNAFMLLIFSDGDQLQRHHNPFALEALAFWPQVAWFDLREPRFWDASGALLARYRLPLYPATPAGLLQALRRFLSEQRAEPPMPIGGQMALGLAEPAGVGMETYAEQLLGDALPWAQDCALIQPISPGLADQLRRTFHPRLPPQRIERLYRLPDTRVDHAGLTFHADVLAFLRRTCLERRSDAERDQVLDCILAQIAVAEPSDHASLAHLSWEAVRERVRLERDPDDDLARLAQLAHADSPLRGTIRASLEGFGFPKQPDRIPLMVRPRKPQALLRLSRIADGVSAPPSRIHIAALSSLLAVGTALLGFSALSWLRAERQGPNLVVTFPDQSLNYVGFGQTGAQSAGVGLSYDPAPEAGAAVLRPLAQGDPGTTTLSPLEIAELPFAHPAEAVHAVAGELPTVAGPVLLFGQGVWSAGAELPALGPADGLHIRVTAATSVPPCSESRTGALKVQRCPEPWPTQNFERPAWRERVGRTVEHDRILSVGLEIAVGDTPELSAWRNLLLGSGSVDLIYRIEASGYGGEQLEAALAQIRADLGGLAAHSQIAWWSVGVAVDADAIEDELYGFGRSLRLSGDDDLAWLASMNQLFRDTRAGPLRETAILAALRRPQSQPAQRELIWIVPDTKETPTSPVVLPAWVPALVEVPAGPFLMGSSDADTQADEDEKPQHTLELPTYWIGRTEVTNAQFRQFVEGDGYSNPVYWTEAGWAWRQENARTQPYYWDDLRWNGDDQPVVGVSWFEAVAYVRWLSAQTGIAFRLPTEAEWEKAARGTDGQTWPWGDPWAEGLANTSEAGLTTTTPVSQFPLGASPYGALDMAGNVYEWCATEWQKPYPYALEDEWAADYLERDDVNRVIRGGAWSSEQKFARGAFRRDDNARFIGSNNVGLRVASSSPSP